MFSIYHQQSRWRRREWLCIGGLSCLGLSTSTLHRALAEETPRARRANACIFIFLFGGPSHIDLWDMKPDAPAEVRGEFKPIQTRTAGIEICEHLPKLAQQTDKLCLLRSMNHHMPVHGPACSEIYSGRPYFGPPTTDQAQPQDWPSLSSMVMRFGSRNSPVAPSVVLPGYSQFEGQGKRIAGQTGGRMGEQFNPFVCTGDPSEPNFQIPGMTVSPDVPADRLIDRRSLLRRLEDVAGQDRVAASAFSTKRQTAFSMLARPECLDAFTLSKEPSKTRQQYGIHKFGQSLLLARRLVEAGVSLVTVNWDDETRFDKVSPFWDTHHDNFGRLANHLAPRFDQSFSAFLQDMEERGLLETTLVVAVGEFGRTPKIGQFVQNSMTEKTGRDHWPHAFTALLAGGGVRGGQVYGRTNSIGGYVEDKPVTPADLSATILSHLGIDYTAHYKNLLFNQMHQICEGTPIADLG